MPSGQSGPVAALIGTTLTTVAGFTAYVMLIRAHNPDAVVVLAGLFACLSLFLWNGKRSERQ